MPAVSTYQPPRLTLRFSLRHSLILMTAVAVAAGILAVPLRGISPWRWLLLLAAGGVAAAAFAVVTAIQAVRFRRQLQAIGDPLGEVRYRSRVSTLALASLVVAQLALTVFVLAMIATATNVWIVGQKYIGQPVILGILAAALHAHFRIGNRLVYGTSGVTDGKQFYPWKSLAIASRERGAVIQLRRKGGYLENIVVRDACTGLIAAQEAAAASELPPVRTPG